MIQQQEVNGDSVIPGRNGTALVSSKSQPGWWHCVKAGKCDCKGFELRGQCRHVRAVAQLVGQTVTINPTFDLAARTLAGDYTVRNRREDAYLTAITAGEDMSYTEWLERRAS